MKSHKIVFADLCFLTGPIILEYIQGQHGSMVVIWMQNVFKWNSVIAIIPSDLLDQVFY